MTIRLGRGEARRTKTQARQNMLQLSLTLPLKMSARMKFAIPLALLLSVQAAAAQTAALPPADQVETVTSEAPKTPLEKAIAGFVKSYATPTFSVGKIPKWARGICPATVGLTAELNLGVTALLRQVAARIGAPVAAKEPCDTNVTVIFTRTPQAVLDDMAKNHQALLGYHEVSQVKRIATMSHPVQAWYATATRDNNGVLIPDSAVHDPQCESDIADLKEFPPMTPAWMVAYQNVYRHCGGVQVTGNRLNDGLRSEFGAATIIVDVGKLGELGIKPVANYVAMLALSQTQTFEACQPLLSIVNVMTPGCDESLKPDSLSETDIAYLSALYKTNPDIMLAGQQSSIAHQMETALGGH